MVTIGNDWDEILKGEFEKEYYLKLRKFLIDEYKHKTIYPNKNDIYNSIKATPYNKVKVVIIGQDPYHGKGQAHGLCFSVNKGVEIPPSLKNIYKELNDDLNFNIPSHGCLMEWSMEGVLLLNTVLTVREGEANSHKGKGWEELTDRIIIKLNERQGPMVFILWGNNAKSKESLITAKQHLVLKSAHPSPLSAYHGFWGCKHFSKANEFLEDCSGEINWQIKE